MVSALVYALRSGPIASGKSICTAALALPAAKSESTIFISGLNNVDFARWSAFSRVHGAAELLVIEGLYKPIIHQRI